jgi:hypothetical protein
MDMMELHWSIEELLARTSQGWRWLRFLRRSIILATVATGLILTVGLGISGGLIGSAAAATGWYLVLMFGAILAWMVIAVECAVVPDDRLRLAASIEEANAPLKDRLNTLVYLEEQGSRRPHPYADAISRQASKIISFSPPLRPFSPAPVFRRFGVMAAVVALTLMYYDIFQPWQRLKAAQVPPQASAEEPSLEIPLPKEQPREEPTWGEVRITRPGGDVRATPLESVPLEIEAASNRPLKQVEWSTAINGGTLQRHTLPSPAGSHFGVYNPKLDLKALGAKALDVVSYSARATAADGKSFESDVYFVEVAPLPEELKQIPGGRDGPSQGLLERLTDMIQRQEEVIRQTQKLEQLSDRIADRNLPRAALAREEGDLSDSARHIGADAEGELDEDALAEVDKRLEQSAAFLSEAQKSLPEGKLDGSLRNEEAALGALTAARKQFRENLLKQLAEAAKHPDAPQPAEPAARSPAEPDRQSAQNKDGDPPPPNEGSPKDNHAGAPDATSPDAKAGEAARGEAQQREAQQREARLAERLGQMQSRQGQIESVRETVKKVLAGERDLQRSPDLRNPATMPRAAQRQAELQKTLQQSTETNSACMGNCQNESASAQAAMGRAAQAMRPGQAAAPGVRGPGAAGPAAARTAGEAADALQKLDDALERQQERNALAEAYQLKRMLDNEIGKLGQAEGQGSSPAEAKANAQESKSITGAMKGLADQAPTGPQFRQPLHDALSDPNKQKLDAQGDRLAQAKSPADRSQAAGQLRKGLEQVSRAFDASRPSGVGRHRTPSPQLGKEALAKGLRQLRDLANRQAQNGAQPEGADSDARLEALGNIEGGLDSIYGYNSHTRDVMEKLRKEIQQPKIVIDIKIIEGLLQQIQPRAREAAAETPPEQKDARQTHIDPSHLPPAYRKSIESYFQKLSEQR